jgi:adenosine kinase
MLTPGDTPAGTCAVLVHQGERSLVANLGAANKFTPDHLATPQARDLISKAQYFYVASFFLTVSAGREVYGGGPLRRRILASQVSVESLLDIAQHAVENSKVFAINLSAPFLIQFFQVPHMLHLRSVGC